MKIGFPVLMRLSLLPSLRLKGFWEFLASWLQGKQKKEAKKRARSVFSVHTLPDTGKREANKYSGGTSDAITSSSLIVSLIMTSFDNFLPPNMAILVVRKKNTGKTDEGTNLRTDERTRPLIEMRSCI